MKNISLLGATGSIGQQTLDLIRSAPERYKLKALAAAGSNLQALSGLINEFKPELVAVKDQAKAAELANLLDFKLPILTGTDGLNAVASYSESDTAVVALVGAVGMEPTMAALKEAKNLVIANKETLVAAGELVRKYLNDYGGSLIPADSEHVALHQCLDGKPESQIKNVYITASGGPFREFNVNFDNVTPQQALKHPTWQMGPKITIDSATLMNKGLEVIEAERLFNLPYEKIQVLIHPQSLIHSLAEFIDGNILAQLGPNDMRLALQYALDWPHRKPNLSGKFLNFAEISKLEFSQPNFERFPCLKLAYQAGKLGQTYPAVLGAADEIAVELFLNEQIRFSAIPQMIEGVLNTHKPQAVSSLEVVCEADHWARDEAMQIYKSKFSLSLT